MEENSGIDNPSETLNLQNHQKKLYVCNFPRFASKQELIDVFSAYGDISSVFFSPGRFSFIKYSRSEDAQKALDAARKSEITLRKKILYVNIAKSKVEKKKKNNEKKMSIKKKGKFGTKKEEITGPALIDKLDDDCLIEIFLYLPYEKRLEIEEVCIRWRDVVKRAWHDVRHFEFHNRLGPVFFIYQPKPKYIEKVLVRCGIYLQSLDLHSVCTSNALQTIRDYCHNLTTIKLAFTRCSIKHFNAFSKMEKLKSFTLTDIQPKFLMNTFQSLPRTVKSINIAAKLSTDILDYSFKNLQASITGVFEEFNNLDSLTMKGYSFRRHLIEAISKKEMITKLSLAFSEIKKGLSLLTNLSNLERLDLQRVHAVDNYFLASLSSKCQKLKYLDVSHCIQLSDKGIRELKILDNLEVLLINDMANSVTDLSIGQLRGIKRLECEHCFEVRDPGIMQLLKNCPILEQLNVVGTSISKDTLQLAINVTKERKNSVVLSLTADIFKMQFSMSEDYSPFLRINGTMDDLYLSDDGADDYDIYNEDDEYEDFYNEYENGYGSDLEYYMDELRGLNVEYDI